ncbi:hypothetical protein BCR41DRAFT_356807 [Lobosporangium transversale]|uniref:Uncharacterized protein n=1 Tax=Lobosporangium transversale TaxID=64571 RepID=A0A1Y2GLJ3_9FUNG|nr:hypothetical protein BCR41DRAFT_357296 [Lobosporangium transversale]XP_021879810.1 hypothetical protein BCR41DRAFT_356807 [Lobosporangium transversale]ORZ10982.1 hypothetical protein BCR41DRAFT_357296 [Lobosporangium transversale]ORZ11713.1 hypothetical protein BCR41DRAFT_356807 [Lobosporangium transversale]|eukprot:XP_021879499.1 hypothetical protein BCR41DRAFT_357296 [Lobosporangium transversale]
MMCFGRVDLIYYNQQFRCAGLKAQPNVDTLNLSFFLSMDARDAHLKQLLKVFPHLKDKSRVVRYANIKMDQHYPENYRHVADARSRRGTRPHFGQLLRVETRFVNMGNTSVKFQHRFLTVPQSQASRDFNNRDEDILYTELKEGDEPERLIASAEGALVFIKWQEDDKGHRFFKPTQGVFHNLDLAAPKVIHFLRETAPERRPSGSARPKNAFRVQIHLRKSDEDELGHVTNSRYVSLIHDVLTFGLRTGYYANGAGISQTPNDLHVIPSHSGTNESDIAVPAGSMFYKRGTIYELYVGYERELKVKPGVYVWSWVEQDKIQDEYDVIRFEICSTEDDGQEQVVSLSRAIVKEDTTTRPSL